MNLDLKITLKGIMESRGANMRLLLNPSKETICFYWNICCGRPICDFSKS